MVDIVCLADTVRKCDKIVYGCKDIILCNVLGAKVIVSFTRKLSDPCLFSLCLLDDRVKSSKVDLVLYSAVTQIISEYSLGIYGVVGE